MTGQTCQRCLCTFNASYLALNCFPNNTCRFFKTFPRSYTIQHSSQARLYFLQQIFPNTSQRCMSNTTDLMTKLSTANITKASLSAPRCLVIDNHGYLVTVTRSLNANVRFYPNNLTILQNISSPFISQSRDMMMLHNGQILLVVSISTSSLLFFDASKNYNLFYQQSVNYTYPHGLRYVNDSFFYVKSWSDNTIYSYSANQNSLVWTETLFLNATPIAPTRDGNHLVIDNCDRYWFILGANGIKIFDNQGLLIQSVPQLATYNFDAAITADYVIYISSRATNQTIRIDPHIQC